MAQAENVEVQTKAAAAEQQEGEMSHTTSDSPAVPQRSHKGCKEYPLKDAPTAVTQQTHHQKYPQPKG